MLIDFSLYLYEFMTFVVDNTFLFLTSVDDYVYDNWGVITEADQFASIGIFFVMLLFFVLSLFLVWLFYKVITYFFNLVCGRIL